MNEKIKELNDIIQGLQDEKNNMISENEKKEKEMIEQKAIEEKEIEKYKIENNELISSLNEKIKQNNEELEKEKKKRK